MKQKHVNIFARQLKNIFCESKLNQVGKSMGYAHRERKITPGKLVIATIKAFSCSKVETIADVQRCFNSMFNCDVAYKPFHNQLSKPKFSAFMREVTNSVFEQILRQIYSFDGQDGLSEFESVYIQDGTSFSLKDTLRQIFPGRFTKVSPAAVELHVTYDLCHENPVHITLTADKESERAELPKPNQLTHSLILADCGYPSFEYFKELQLHQGSYLMKMQKKINPFIIDRRKKDIKRYTGLPLKQAKENLSKKKAYDFDVVFRDDKSNTKHRLIVKWNKQQKEFVNLITNLPRERYTSERVMDVYRLRWQVELLFKEWKSYANLHAFDTSKESIAEGFIWAAIIAALIKRYMAHTTQFLKKVEVSTRKVAMCAVEVLPDIFKAIVLKKWHKLKRVFYEAIVFLSTNALRAHPKRDREKGRSKLGMTPVYVLKY